MRAVVCACVACGVVACAAATTTSVATAPNVIAQEASSTVAPAAKNTAAPTAAAQSKFETPETMLSALEKAGRHHFNFSRECDLRPRGRGQ